MQTYDLIMLIVLGAATVLGFWKGMAWQVASLASIIVSYFVAVQFQGKVAQHIGAAPPWNQALAMLLLYVASSFVIWMAFRMVAGTIDALRMKSFDRQLGAVLGVAKGVLLCVVITLFAVAMLGDEEKQAIVDSNSGYYIARLLDRSGPMLPDEIHQIIDPYTEPLEDRLNDEPPLDISRPEWMPELPQAEGKGGLMDPLPELELPRRDWRATQAPAEPKF